MLLRRGSCVRVRLRRFASAADAATPPSPPPPAPYDVLFFGSDRVSVATLAALHAAPQSLVRSLRVVCAETARPVRSFAAQARLPTFVKPRQTPLAQWRNVGGALPAAAADSAHTLAVVVSFGHFLPPALLARFGAGALNVHPSLLPALRGAAPIQHALLRGERRTGVSLITLDPRTFDAGRVLLQRELAIGEHERFNALTDRLAALGAECALEVLAALPGHVRDAREQCGTVTHAPRLSRDDARVRWTTSSAADVYRQWRALGELFGGLHCRWRARRIKMVTVSPPDVVAARVAALAADQPQALPPERAGAFVFDRRSDALLVRCADGTCAGVQRVCVEGKSAVSARQFALGYRLFRRHAATAFEEVFT